MPGVLRCAVACPARTVRRHRWSSQEASRRQSAGMRRGASSSRAPTLGGGAHKIQTHCRPEPCPRSGRQSHSAQVSMQSAVAGAAVARRARSPYPSLTDAVGATLRGWRRKGTAHCRTAGTSCPTDEGWTGRRGRPSLQRQHRSAVRRQERDRGNIQAKNHRRVLVTVRTTAWCVPASTATCSARATTLAPSGPTTGSRATRRTSAAASEPLTSHSKMARLRYGSRLVGGGKV